jgi:hypothetical protein
MLSGLISKGGSVLSGIRTSVRNEGTSLNRKLNYDCSRQNIFSSQSRSALWPSRLGCFTAFAHKDGSLGPVSENNDAKKTEICDFYSSDCANVNLCQQLLLNKVDITSTGTWCLVLALLAGVFLVPGAADAATLAVSNNHSIYSANNIADLAENEDFWGNVLRYVSYFFSVLLGTAYVALKPIVELLKRPTTAILVILGAAGLYLFVSTTVSAMLGVNEFEYDPSSIVTPM